ncbi:sigma-70 family RNA polymerase sigma factor [Nitriliruptoraceae bacterium ZYF776]|nr:sigma-70 family RNA polymerase sigma factor [Profundirhabdus halotolerans]
MRVTGSGPSASARRGRGRRRRSRGCWDSGDPTLAVWHRSPLRGGGGMKGLRASSVIHSGDDLETHCVNVDELFERHGEVVTRYVRRRLADQADADEVIADVFVRAWRARRRAPQTVERERAWLYTIARNAVIDRYRRTARAQRLHERLRSSFTGDFEPPPELPDDELAEAFHALSASDRELLRLVVWDELPHAEIAEILGCREQNVAVRLHRARARLRRHLNREPLPDPEPSATRRAGHPERTAP